MQHEQAPGTVNERKRRFLDGPCGALTHDAPLVQDGPGGATHTVAPHHKPGRGFRWPLLAAHIVASLFQGAPCLCA